MRVLACLCAVGLFSACLLFAQKGFENQDVEVRIDALLKQMTLEEKVGQLVQYSAGTPTGPGTGRAGYAEEVAKGRIGSLLNLTGAQETNAMQRIAMEQSRLKIPLLFGLDVIHGYHTIFPVPLGMASTWDPQLVEQASRTAAREASADGIRWTFSPMVDIARDARWGRIVESAGEDPYLGSLMAAAYVRGYQGTRLDAPDSIAACVKHYVGYGAAVAGRDYNAADMSERTLREIYLPPFESAVNAGAATIMSAFNSLNGVPASANAATLTTILRNEWRFPGFVVSDWRAVDELIPLGVAADDAIAAQKALVAGVDMDMESGLYSRHVAELVRSGAIPQSVLDEAVRRVLRVKFALGLFGHPYTEATSGQPKLSIDLARTIAERSLVLLRNTAVRGSPLLPIADRVRSIALVGPFGDSAINMLGSWPGKGDLGNADTLRSALQERMARVRGQLLFATGTEIEGSNDEGFASALAAAKAADLTIAALGEDAARMTGEAASRAHLGLPGNQEQLLEQLIATGKPVVLIVFSGRPLALQWAAQHVPAIVEAWYPGIQAGPAIVEALFGDTDFTGRLTVSVPRSVGQEPLYYNELNTGRPAGGYDLTHPPANSDEKYVSRYIDEQNTPLFPFGYGLSYTHVTYSPVELSASSANAQALTAMNATIRAATTVTNRGTRKGREVVQLYLGQRGTSVARPVKELRGFQLLDLAPGESQRVEFVLGRDELSFWNLEMKYGIEPEVVTVSIGPNSDEGQQAQFTITP